MIARIGAPCARQVDPRPNPVDIMLLLPIRIEAVLTEFPWANCLFIAACSIVSIAVFNDLLPESVVLAMIADGWHPAGLFGHMLLHGDYVHLAGNMLFLWVFGNAVCGTARNGIYLVAFPLCGVVAAAIHNFAVGGAMVGASGAINGVIGFALAIYPINRVHLFYWAIVRLGTFGLPVWAITLFWFAFDIFGASTGAEGVAYWAHIGGLVSGVALGVVMLKGGWIVLTEWDNPTLVDVFAGRRAPR